MSKPREDLQELVEEGPDDSELAQLSPGRKGEEDPALQAESAEEFAEAITHDLGEPSSMGRIADLGIEDEEAEIPFGD